MNNKDSIQNITKELKTLLVKTKKELKTKDEAFKKKKTVHELTKKEYQTLLNDHAKLKKKTTAIRRVL